MRVYEVCVSFKADGSSPSEERKVRVAATNREAAILLTGAELQRLGFRFDPPSLRIAYASVAGTPVAVRLPQRRQA